MILLLLSTHLSPHPTLSRKTRWYPSSSSSKSYNNWCLRWQCDSHKFFSPFWLSVSSLFYHPPPNLFIEQARKSLVMTIRWIICKLGMISNCSELHQYNFTFFEVSQNTVKTKYMTAVCDLGSDKIIIQAYIAIQFLSTRVNHLLHILPVTWFIDFKVLTLGFGR